MPSRTTIKGAPLAPLTRARRHADERRAPGAQRLENRVDSVDAHVQMQPRKHEGPRRTRKRTSCTKRFSSCVFVLFVASWLRYAAKRARECRRALTIAEDPGEARRFRQLRTA